MFKSKRNIFVTSPFLPSIFKYIFFIFKIWKSKKLTNNGFFLKKLQEELSNYFNVNYLNVVNNGTTALQIAIKALDLKGEIITTPFSYVATTNVILWEGCTPIFVDINLDSFCIDVNRIEQSITSKTVAILATHVYGNPCNVSEIGKLAKKYNLKVIYDAAHAFGVNLAGKSILNFGDISILSFHSTKVFHTIEGGAVICKSKKIHNKVSLMKAFGHIGEKYLSIGINAKMSEFHAIMGLCNLPFVKNSIYKRQKLSNLYDTLLCEIFIKKILTKPVLSKKVSSNYSYYPVLFKSPSKLNRLKKELETEGFYPRRYFYPSLNKLPFLEKKIKCFNSEFATKRILALPLFDSLSKKNVIRICNIIKTTLLG